jgi:hypothetical protein
MHRGGNKVFRCGLWQTSMFADLRPDDRDGAPAQSDGMTGSATASGYHKACTLDAE